MNSDTNPSMAPNNLQNGEYIYDKNEQKATKDLTCFCVSGKGQPFIDANFDWDVRTLPLPTMQPRYSVSRLAQKHLSILINILFSRKDVNTFRR
jgi:hypothetical protein